MVGAGGLGRGAVAGEPLLGVDLRLTAGALAAHHHEVHRRQAEQDDGGPDVEAQAEDVLVLHVVDPQHLDPAAAGGVGHHVQRHHPPVPEPEAAVGPQHEAEGAEVPQALVEERRLEGGVLLVARRPVLRVDLQRPGLGRRPPEQLLVEPVPPAAHRLRDQDAGCHRVEHGRDPDSLRARAEPDADRAEGDRAPDAEAAAPDVERLDRAPALAEVEVVVGDHVVDPAADDAERHRPQRQVGHLAA
jgi:hypothetical protein